MDQFAYRMARATGSDGELFHLGRAREAYVRGDLDLDQLERAVEHVLRGGYLGEDFALRARGADGHDGHRARSFGFVRERTVFTNMQQRSR